MIEKIESLYFSVESFEKFTNPNDPLYEQYKDRGLEMMHDKGWNNALDCAIREITGVPVEPWEIRLKNE